MKLASLSRPQLMKGLIYITPFFVLGWLGIQYFSFFGDLHIEYDFSGESPFISELGPRGRVLDREKNMRTGEVYQKIVGDPAYMDVEVPRSFDSVDVRVEYISSNQPFVELGLVKSTEPWSVELKPLYSTVLDQALDTWDVVQDDSGRTLLQKELKYDSIDAFLAQYPTDQQILTYGVDISSLYRDDTYSAQEGELAVDRLLRGPHHFLTYIKNEPLHIEFDLRDMNREFNADPIKIEVYRGNELVHEALANDDGITEANGVLSDKTTLVIDLPDAQDGLYQYKVVVNDDILIEQIRTTQHKFVAKNNLFLINNEEYRSAFPEINTDPTPLYAQASKITFTTDHPTGLQTVAVQDDYAHVDIVHRPYIWVNPEPSTTAAFTLVVPKNDLFIQGKGFFAFTPDSFFDADYLIQQLDETATLDDASFILAQGYTAPVETNATRTQQVHFDLNGVTGDRKQLKFAVSAQGIDRERYILEVRSVQFDFHRAPLYNRILNRLHQ